DLDVLLSPSGGEHDRSFERIVTGRRVDGVILMEIRLDDPRVGRLQDVDMPFVAIGRTARPQGMCWVDVDYATLVARCVDHLADLGHRHLALLNRPAALVNSGYGPGQRSQEGFVEAVARRRVLGTEFCCADEVAAGESCVLELLQTHPEVSGIVTVNEAAL